MKDNITPTDILRIIDEVKRRQHYAFMACIIGVFGGAAWVLGYHVALLYFAIVFTYYLVRWLHLHFKHNS